MTRTFPDPFNLARFISAQDGTYDIALQELSSGQKQSHWIWFVFPQIDGLGSSPTAKTYAIKSLEEAKAYYQHPILGVRLLECTRAVIAVEGKTALEIFGTPDNLKFRSSMTLFELVTGQGREFSTALEKYFDGERDEATLKIVRGKELE